LPLLCQTLSIYPPLCSFLNFSQFFQLNPNYAKPFPLSPPLCQTYLFIPCYAHLSTFFKFSN
jgi:hypothetical protein